MVLQQHTVHHWKHVLHFKMLKWTTISGLLWTIGKLTKWDGHFDPALKFPPYLTTSMSSLSDNHLKCIGRAERRTDRTFFDYVLEFKVFVGDWSEEEERDENQQGYWPFALEFFSLSIDYVLKEWVNPLCVGIRQPNPSHLFSSVGIKQRANPPLLPPFFGLIGFICIMSSLWKVPIFLLWPECGILLLAC